jgi:hypothetical protein
MSRSEEELNADCTDYADSKMPHKAVREDLTADSRGFSQIQIATEGTESTEIFTGPSAGREDLATAFHRLCHAGGKSQAISNVQYRIRNSQCPVE